MILERIQIDDYSHENCVFFLIYKIVIRLVQILYILKCLNALDQNVKCMNEFSD